MAVTAIFVVAFYKTLYTSQSVIKTITIIIGIYCHCKAHNHQSIRFRCDDPDNMSRCSTKMKTLLRSGRSGRPNGCARPAGFCCDMQTCHQYRNQRPSTTKDSTPVTRRRLIDKAILERIQYSFYICIEGGFLCSIAQSVRCCWWPES